MITLTTTTKLATKSSIWCQACRCSAVLSLPRQHAGPSASPATVAPNPLPRQYRHFASSPPVESGHNRWSKIRHRKGAADAQRSALFSRLTHEIHQALKPPNSLDPSSNSRLAAAVQKAREGGVPKSAIENIFTRAKAAADGSGQSVTYEAVGPGGKVAFIIECMTDNPTRTVRRVKEALHKNGCRISPTAYLFTQKGCLTLSANASTSTPGSSSTTTPTFDDLFDLALEHGAEDVREVSSDANDPSMAGSGTAGTSNSADRTWEIITSLSDLATVTDVFCRPPHDAKWIVESSERTFLPIDPLPVVSSDAGGGSASGSEEEAEVDHGITEERAEAVERIVEILENESEVVRVWTNLGD